MPFVVALRATWCSKACIRWVANIQIQLNQNLPPLSFLEAYQVVNSSGFSPAAEKIVVLCRPSLLPQVSTSETACMMLLYIRDPFQYP